jgi:hypothetical protein
VISDDGHRCPKKKAKGSAYCTTHGFVLSPKPQTVRGLYRRYLPDKLKPLYDEMFDDPAFFSNMNEIALHRAVLCDYLDRCNRYIDPKTKKNEPQSPDPHVIALHTEIIRRLIESQKGRKYFIGVAGVGMLMESMAEMVVRKFGDQPERLKALLEDFKTIPLSSNDSFDVGRPPAHTQAAAYPTVGTRKKETADE